MLIFCISHITAQEYLLAVEGLAEKEDYCIIEEPAPQTYIVIANDGDLERLQQCKSSYNILDVNPRENEYYFVFPVAETKEAVTRVGTILAEYTDETEQKEFQTSYLVRVPEGKKDLLFELRAEKNYLEFDRVVFRTAPPPGFRTYNPETAKYNQLIQDMVDAVSEDTLRYMVTYLQDIQSRHASYDYNREEAVPWICDLLKKYGCDSVFAQDINSSSYDAPNPVGIKLGKKYPSYTRYYIVGGHPDCQPTGSVNYGADDNATGTAMFIEAARVMQHYNFEYTIVYMGFNAEEVGLLGSAYWAKVAEQRGDTIMGVISYDMVGHTRNYERLRIRYYTQLSGCQEYAEIFEAATEMYTQLELSVSGMSEINGWSDHASFWRKGFLALYGMEGEMCSNVYHTVGDTVDSPEGLNDFPFFTRTVQAAVAATAVAECAAVMDVTDTYKPVVKMESNPLKIIPTTGSNIIINFTLEKSQPVTLQIYNSFGQVINSIANDNFQKGNNSVVWDCRDNNGKPVAKGLYFIEYSCKTGKIFEKIMLPN